MADAQPWAAELAEFVKAHDEAWANYGAALDRIEADHERDAAAVKAVYDLAMEDVRDTRVVARKRALMLMLDAQGAALTAWQQATGETRAPLGLT